MSNKTIESFPIRITNQYLLQNVRSMDEIYALVELITNCDDAYMEKKELNNEGVIWIREKTLKKSKKTPLKTLSVSDKAGGLTEKGLKNSFKSLSTDEVSSRNTRGFFGRGSKDIALLGPTVFKSIVNGKYSALRLELGKNGLEGSWIPREESADKIHFKDLMLNKGESGLTATIEIKKRFNFSTLIKKVKQHYALRDILERRVVKSIDENGRETELTSLNEKRKSYIQVVTDQRISVQGYDDIVLSLWKLPKGDYAVPNDSSDNGILLKGKFGIHGNSLFDMQNTHPESLGFHGELNMPQLEDINRAVMKARTQNAELDNSLPIKPDRSGIDFKAPYTNAVKNAVVAFLKEYFKSQESSESSSSHSLEELFSRHASDFKTLYKEMTDSLDLDDTGGISESDIDIIPTKKYADLDVTATFTLKILKDVVPKDIKIKIIPISGEFSLESESLGGELDWRHSEDGKYRTASICVKSKKKEGELKLEAHYQDSLASTAILLCPTKPWVAPPEIVELRFKTPTATIKKKGGRRLELWGPVNLIGESVTCKYDNDLTKGPKSIFLSLSSSKDYSVGILAMRAGDVDGETHIEATIRLKGDVLKAGCRLKISDATPDEDKIPTAVIETTRNSYVRSFYDKESHQIKIYARHPSCGSAFDPFLNSTDSSKSQIEKLSGCLEIFTEIYASELSRWFVWRHFEKNPPSQPDFNTFLTKFDSTRSTLLIKLRKSWSSYFKADLRRSTE